MSSETPVPSTLKVVELREELSKRGLDTKGLKKDLVDRLTAALDLSISGGSTTAPPNDEMKEMAQPLGQKNAAVFTEEKESAKEETKQEVKQAGEKKETAVGHEMVEGADERAEEIDAQAEKAVSSADIELEPACLDPEVAAVVAKEEAKAALPPTPPEVRSISPASPERDMSIDAESSTPRKRSRSPSAPIQRQKRRTHLPLPSSLSHLIYPPTCTLYITNLRRPLVHSALHDHLFPSSTPPGPSSRLPPARQPFAGESYPALWLSGIKDHAYAAYLSEQDALEAAERIEGKRWPDDTGADLHVEFVQDDLVQMLVQEEERAWMNGRQKLGLAIRKDEEAETGYRFELTGGNAGLRGAPTGPARRLPVPAPLADGAARAPVRPDAPANAPTGPSRPNGFRGPENFSIRGRGGHFGATRPPADNGYGSRAGRDDRDIRGVVVPPGSALVMDVGPEKEAGRLSRPVKRTNARPFLTWREGPGAVRTD